MSRQPSCMVTQGGRCTLGCHLRIPCQHLVDTVGKLEPAMYGTRDAPMIWQDHLRETLLDTKFKESATNQGCFNMKLEIFFLRTRG